MQTLLFQANCHETYWLLSDCHSIFHQSIKHQRYLKLLSYPVIFMFAFICFRCTFHTYRISIGSARVPESVLNAPSEYLVSHRKQKHIKLSKSLILFYEYYVLIVRSYCGCFNLIETVFLLDKAQIVTFYNSPKHVVFVLLIWCSDSLPNVQLLRDKRPKKSRGTFWCMGMF